jgi:hypothetical protein
MLKLMLCTVNNDGFLLESTQMSVTELMEISPYKHKHATKSWGQRANT